MELDLFTRRYAENHPAEVARALELSPVDDAAGILSSLPVTTSSLIICYLSQHTASRALLLLPPEHSESIIASLQHPVAASLLRALPADSREGLINTISIPAGVRMLLRYPDEVAGAHMDPDFITIPAGYSVVESRTYLRARKDHVKNTVYVTSGEHTLSGMVEVRDLVLANDVDPLAGYIQPVNSTVSARESIDTLKNHPFLQQHGSLPVVDRSGRLLGVLTYESTQRAISRGAAQNSQLTDPLEVIFDLSDLLFDTCSGLILSGSPDKHEE